MRWKSIVYHCGVHDREASIRPRSALCGSGAEARTEQRHHVVGLRVATDHRLRENQLVADVDVEDAARSRHQLDGADARLKLFEDSRCQTDSVWPRASRNAVLDANDGSTGHEPMLSPDREYGRRLDRGSLRFRDSKAGDGAAEQASAIGSPCAGTGVGCLLVRAGPGWCRRSCATCWGLPCDTAGGCCG